MSAQSLPFSFIDPNEANQDLQENIINVPEEELNIEYNQNDVIPFKFVGADDFYTSQKPEEQGVADYLAQTGTQAISRILERIGGLPGDIYKLGKGLLTGQADITSELPFFPEELKKQREKNISESSIIPLIEKALSLEGGGPSPFSIPGSQEFKESSQDLSKGFTKPQDRFQEAVSEGAETFADLFLTGKGGKFSGSRPTLARSTARKVGQSIASQGSKELLKSMGYDEKTQDVGKLGTLFLTSLTFPALFGERSVQNVYKDFYNQRDRLINPNAKTSANTLISDLNRLENQLGGIQTEATRPIIQQISEVRELVQNGEISPTQLVDTLRRINTNRAALYNIPHSARNELRRNYNRLYNSVDKAFSEWAELENPQALAAHRSGNEVFGAFSQSRKVSNYIRRIAPKLSTTSPLIYLFKDVLPTAGVSSAIAGATYGGIKSFEVMHRINNSPLLQRYYADVISNALKEDSASLIRSVNKFDNEYKKENKSNKKTKDFGFKNILNI